MLGRDPAPDEVAHQHWHKRDGEAGRRGHGVGLGEGQRFEHPPFLRLEREDRDEAQRDDQKREEQRGADLYGRVGQRVPARFALQGIAVVFQMLVVVFDHHDGRIHHRADGDGNAAQGHDIGVDALELHDDEGRKDAQRQAEHDDQRRTEVE